jgi:hypothetical protein
MIIIYRSWAKNVVVAHKSQVESGAATMALAADGGGGKGGAGGDARGRRETGGKVGDSSSSSSSSRGSVEGIRRGGGGGGGGGGDGDGSGGRGRFLLSEQTKEGAHEREFQNDVKPPPRPFRVRVD